MENNQHHHYDHYSANQIKRLDGFYGLIENELHKEILPYISGDTILDIGCGFGSLCNFFNDKGFKVTGIEQHKISLDAGILKYPHLKLVLDNGTYLDSLPDNSFDTVIMKDVMHHVVAETNIKAFMQSLRRICKKRILIIDPNITFILRICRKIIKHVDPECSYQLAKSILQENGFVVSKLFFSEVLAFPLSGGFVGTELVKSKILMKIFLGVDRFLKKILDVFCISRFVCWRYIIVADKR